MKNNKNEKTTRQQKAQKTSFKNLAINLKHYIGSFIIAYKTNEICP